MSDNNYPPNAGQPEDQPDETVDESREDAAHKSEAEPHPSREEITELNDRVLRLAAELENTRRRSEREKSDAGRYAIANFARDLLAVADNFERALRTADDDGAAPTTEAMTGLLSGLRMTEKELLTVLERHGVRRIFPEREKFDPNLHQAVAQVPGGTIPVGHVVDVAQPGFTIGERVLRAAIVTVSSGVSAEQNDNGADAGSHVDTEA